jgi:hypothetical protein
MYKHWSFDISLQEISIQKLQIFPTKTFQIQKKNHRNFHPEQLHILFDIPIKKLPHSHLDEK